jgi:hypothetical protein
MELSWIPNCGSFRSVNKTYFYIVFGALIAWSLYRRVRRSIGRQKLRTGRIIFVLVVLCLAAFFSAIAGLLINPRLLAGLGAGTLGGVILGFISLKLTKFETTQEGHFYKPDTRLGVVISMLFVGRIIYRMAALKDADMSVSAGHPPAGQSPLTFAITGLVFGYYIVYYIGLLVHTHDKTPATVAAAQPQPAPPVLSDDGTAAV